MESVGHVIFRYISPGRCFCQVQMKVGSRHYPVFCIFCVWIVTTMRPISLLTVPPPYRSPHSPLCCIGIQVDVKLNYIPAPLLNFVTRTVASTVFNFYKRRCIEIFGAGNQAGDDADENDDDFDCRVQ